MDLAATLKRFRIGTLIWVLAIFLSTVAPTSALAELSCEGVFAARPYATVDHSLSAQSVFAAHGYSQGAQSITTQGDGLKSETLRVLNQELSRDRKARSLGAKVKDSLVSAQSNIALWVIRSVAARAVKRIQKSGRPLSEDLFFEIFDREMNSARGSLAGLIAGERLVSLLEAAKGERKAVTGELRRYLTLANETYPVFRQDWDRLKTRFGARFFTEEGFKTALMNVYAMRMFSALSGRSPEPYSAIVAIASLHPLVDTAIDERLANPASMRKIAAHLVDQNQTPEGPFENAVIALINDIYRELPPAEHPDLVWLLKETFASEMASAMQNHSAFGPESLKITVEKGAFSTSAFGYIAMRGMTPNEFHFFYKAGALFQLMDDYCDLKIDLANGTDTLFTSELRSDSSVERGSDALIALFKSIRSDLESDPAKAFKNQSGFERFLTLSFHTQMLTSLAKLSAGAKESGLKSYGQLHPLSPTQMKHFGVRALQLHHYSAGEMKNPFIAALRDFLFEKTEFPDVSPLPPKYQALAERLRERFNTPP